MNDFYKDLSDTITNIKINDEIKTGTFDIRDHISKYSSTKIPSKILFLNNIPVPTKNTYVTYTCSECGEYKEILLKKFLLKTNFICSSCKELDFSKRKNQSDYMHNSYNDFGIVKSFKKFKEKNTIEDLILLSEKKFESESLEFKLNYRNTHLTSDEYLEIIDKIFKVNGVIFDNSFKYYYSVQTNNQMKYSSYLLTDKNKLINFNNVVYICDNCSELFSTTRKPKEKYISDHKYLCPKCYLSNRTFKIKIITNINNEKIKYQSSPELKLIDFCNTNKILIKNGPTVKFIFNNKERKYHIDYYIPKYNLLIEIKGNHVWHKEQVYSGKWKQKENSARIYAIENDLEYFLIFEDKLNDFIIKELTYKK